MAPFLNVKWIVQLVLQLPQNMAGKMLLDFAMAGDRLTHAGSGILVPIVPAAMTDEDASLLLNPSDEFEPLHAIWSSAT
jgi:hypothetical protein